jgi:hypothetical protein
MWFVKYYCMFSAKKVIYLSKQLADRGSLLCMTKMSPQLLLRTANIYGLGMGLFPTDPFM